MSKVFTLQRSQAREYQCRGCGRGVLVFKDTQQLCHQPPECTWFRTYLEHEPSCEAVGEADIVDDTSN